MCLTYEEISFAFILQHCVRNIALIVSTGDDGKTFFMSKIITFVLSNHAILDRNKFK